MTETNRAHGYYSETLDSNSTIAELDQRLQAQRVRLQNATDKLHEEAKKTGLFRSNPSEVHSLQNKADFEAEVLQDIEDEKNLLSRQQRLKANCDIVECASSYRTAPPLWGPLPGAIWSIVRNVCGALLRAGSDQTPLAVGQATIARPS